jgi:hypothetical protein
MSNMPNDIKNMWEEAANISESKKITPGIATPAEKAAAQAALKASLAKTAENAKKDNYRGVGG